MSLYMTQFSYSLEAWQTLAKNPQDRSKPIETLVNRLGGRLLHLYYSFGEYDGLVIFEAPDDIAAAATAIGAVLPGHLKAVKTTKLLTVDETLAMLHKAAGVAFAAPTGS